MTVNTLSFLAIHRELGEESSTLSQPVQKQNKPNTSIQGDVLPGMIIEPGGMIYNLGEKLWV